MLVAMVIAAIAIPKVVTIVQNLRTAGDAQNLNSAILLAKMSAASNAAHARLHADFGTNSFWVEVAPTGVVPTSTTTWTTQGGTQYLAKNVSFGYGSISSAPSNTQSTFGQASTCSGATSTACIEFNSRGIPVDSSNSPTGNDALYVTDGNTVTGVTVAGTGLTKAWRTPASTAIWTQR